MSTGSFCVRNNKGHVLKGPGIISEKITLTGYSRGLIRSTAQNGELPIGKGDKLNKYQSPKIDQEGKERRTNHMLHFWDVNVMYAQVCVLNRFQANPAEFIGCYEYEATRKVVLKNFIGHS